VGSFVSILKLVAIGVVGYLAIALGQTLVLEVLLGGQLAPDSPPTILAAATLGTIASGLIGGYLAAWMGGARPLLHVSLVVAILALDAVFVLVKHVGGNPIWFDLGGALTLMLATAVGGWLRGRKRRPSESSASERA
jgi:hypothetical protein